MLQVAQRISKRTSPLVLPKLVDTAALLGGSAPTRFPFRQMSLNASAHSNGAAGAATAAGDAPAAASAAASLAPLRVVTFSRVAGLHDAVTAEAARRRALDARDLPELELLALPEKSESQGFKDLLGSAEVMLAAPPMLGPVFKAAGGGTAAVRALAPSLRFVQSTFAGVDSLVAAVGADAPFTLCKAGGCFGPQMAEYTLAFILSRERRLPECAQLQRDGEWDASVVGSYRVVSDLCVGVLGGGGDIGGHVLRVVQALGGHTIAGVGKGRAAGRVVEHADEVSDDVEYILRSSDYVVNILPSTPATRGMLGGDVLKACADGGRKVTLINMGRGDVVTEPELLHALENDWLDHAVLDVFETEPLPSDSQLWRHPKVTITPHIAGASRAQDMASIFVENAVRWTRGEPLKGAVDFGRGY